MPRCYILKKHVNQSKKSTVKDSACNKSGAHWQPKTSKSNVALKRFDTPISSIEASICYNNTLENQSGKCTLYRIEILSFFHSSSFSLAMWIRFINLMFSTANGEK